ncbi:MAG: N(4)-(beta-N-acetylglucosaminyl)-L-asparaginase [candidate division KSB1 bacterium]|nr:N(4)-(beta-N-acetylglucosaminyl)-L-asparaginase [candidate division KSB1 bacterium]
MDENITRRSFIQRVAGTGFGMVILGNFPFQNLTAGGQRPIVISTWKHGLPANEAAWAILSKGGSSLDAVEKGVIVAENDPNVTSVGYGGLPNEEGVVELDASIMSGKDRNAGAVAGLRYIKNPIAVARLVMERTNHVLLVGEGALRFALAHGFKKEELLTEEARKQWLHWKETLSDKDDWFPPAQNHDTIGMIALDEEGNLSGACTTSGLAYKIPGRVGDSPIIGAGLYVDNNVGGAAATGRGEEVIKVCGSFAVVENMRRGLSPQQACEEVIQRMIDWHYGKPNFQDCFIALNKKGEVGAASIQKGFQYAVHTREGNKLFEAKALL